MLEPQPSPPFQMEEGSSFPHCPLRKRFREQSVVPLALSIFLEKATGRQGWFSEKRD